MKSRTAPLLIDVINDLDFPGSEARTARCDAHGATDRRFNGTCA